MITALLQQVQSYQSLGVSSVSVLTGSAVSLGTIPQGTIYAIIVYEADSGATDKNKTARFTEDGTTPTDSTGIPLGDMGNYRVEGGENLDNFLIKTISTASSNPGTLKIQFFGNA